MAAQIKTTLLFVLLGSISPLWAQNPLSKTLDFDCAGCPPADALVALSRQTGVNIVFSDRIFYGCPALHLSLRQVSLREVLERTTKCARVSYKVADGQIFLFRKSTRHTLSGFVQDAETGERLIGASVRTSDGLGAATNEFGFFSLQLEEGEYDLAVSYIGYQIERLSVPLDADRLLRVRLRPHSQLPEVVIPARAEPNAGEHQDGSPKYLNLKDLRNLPMPGGEADLLRQTSLQPGVQTGVDGLGGLHVRGGNADQNLFLLDDVPVYSPSHALGLFSIFNPRTVSSARLWKGDFPARYGGRVASVLDVRTRDGNVRDYHAQASAGLFAASAAVEGPIVRDKASFLLGGRTTYFEPWVNFFSKRNNLLTFSGDRVQYRFFDLNAKLNYALNDRNRLYFSYYQGGDRFQNTFAQAYFSAGNFITDRYSLASEWGNNIAAFRWNHLLRPNLFTNTTLRYSRFFYQSTLGFNSDVQYSNGKKYTLANYGQVYQTLIRDWSGKTDFTFYVSDPLTLRWGVSYTVHDFQPGALSANFLQAGQTQATVDSLTSLLVNNERLAADEAEAYFDAEFEPFKNWHIEAGLNASVFQVKNVNYRQLQPRVRLRHAGKKGWSQWLGYHEMAQNLHQIGSFNVSLPFELWVPSTRKVPPEQVWQASAGVGWQGRDWGFQVEAYHKNFDRVLAFISANDALFTGGAQDASGWEDRIAAGTGQARGVECTLEKTLGNTSGSVVYTLLKATRQFGELNSGRPFPFRFDRRHDLKITLRQRLAPWLEADAVWAFATGNPITLASVKFEHQSVEGEVRREVYFYTEVNGYRLPNYHRLDLALNAHFGRGRWQHDLQLGVYNAYNRANPFYLFVDAGSSVRGKAIQYTLLPILPVFKYEIRF
jgi:hypothetical protein